MNVVITEADAIARYPELDALITLRQAGWCFRLILDDDQQPGCLVGSYSRERYTDAIFIYDETHTAAARVLDDTYGGGCVWTTEGRNLADVVHDLITLPEPGMPGAPALVIASPELWTP